MISVFYTVKQPMQLIIFSSGTPFQTSTTAIVHITGHNVLGLPSDKGPKRLL